MSSRILTHVTARPRSLYHQVLTHPPWVGQPPLWLRSTLSTPSSHAHLLVDIAIHVLSTHSPSSGPRLVPWSNPTCLPFPVPGPTARTRLTFSIVVGCLLSTSPFTCYPPTVHHPVLDWSLDLILHVCPSPSPVQRHELAWPSPLSLAVSTLNTCTSQDKRHVPHTPTHAMILSTLNQSYLVT
jgi:hypothetical protein